MEVDMEKCTSRIGGKFYKEAAIDINMNDKC